MLDEHKQHLRGVNAGGIMSEQELNTLRTGLLQVYNEIAQYNCVLYTVFAAALAYAANYDNYLICLIL